MRGMGNCINKQTGTCCAGAATGITFSQRKAAYPISSRDTLEEECRQHNMVYTMGILPLFWVAGLTVYGAAPGFALFDIADAAPAASSCLSAKTAETCRSQVEEGTGDKCVWCTCAAVPSECLGASLAKVKCGDSFFLWVVCFLSLASSSAILCICGVVDRSTCMSYRCNLYSTLYQ